MMAACRVNNDHLRKLMDEIDMTPPLPPLLPLGQLIEEDEEYRLQLRRVLRNQQRTKSS
jgi:hypothetical protein